jgi:hypothetical protein
VADHRSRAAALDDGGAAYRLNAGKPRVDLIDPVSILEIGSVLAYGVAKYGHLKPDWRTGQPWSHMYGSLIRHAAAWWYGEDIDSDSGLPHVWMLGCNAMMIQSTVRLHPELDNRSIIRPEEIPEHVRRTVLQDDSR